MLDRVRESVFSVLHQRLEGARVLDLFAGSGSLGLEALSRGAENALFIEQDRGALAVLKKNIAELGLEEWARAVGGDALSPLSWGEGADVILMDPPYPLLRAGTTRGKVFEATRELGRKILSPDGVILFHAPRGEVREREFGEELAASNREYGTSAIWFLEHLESE